VVAHRGASAEQPENTLASFEAAASARADMVELDVRLTSDGVVVVLHDPDLAATTDLAGPVHTLTLADVKRADASGGRGPRQEVPTLAEVLAMLGRLGIGVDIEVKNIPGEPAYEAAREGILEASLQVLDEVGFRPPALITSFNPVTVARSRELAPEVPTGLLAIGDPLAALELAGEAGHAMVLPHHRAVTEAGAGFVEAAHGAGIAVGTWTVDEEEELATLFSWGVDAVATNDPRRGVAVRDRVVGRSG